MAKFTATEDLNIKWNGLELRGKPGDVYRIPDAYYEDFNRQFASVIAGLTWLSRDEMADLLKALKPK